MSLSRRDVLRAGPLALGLAACGSGSAPPAGRPNILLLVSDQQRFDWVGWNTALPLRTPHLAALAARGARFDRAYCPSPLCAPSRAALAAGREYHRAGVYENLDSYPDGQATFYASLRDAGYRVLSCGKLDLRKGRMSWGRDGQHRVGARSVFAEWGFTGGFDSSGKHDGATGWRAGRVCPYFAFLEERGLAEIYAADMERRGFPGYEDAAPSPLPDDAYPDNWVAEHGLELLRDAEAADEPWFLQVNFNGPHEPMDVTASMFAAWRQVDFPQPHKNRLIPAAKNVSVRRRYAAMIENLDRHLGRFVDELARLGATDDTLVVWTSDHGEMLGDHDKWAKEVPYEPAVRVPLVCAGPGVQPGLVLTAPAATLDLAATFVELAEAVAPAGMDSRSLVPVLAADAERTRDHVLSAMRPWTAVIEERFKLVRGYAPEPGEGIEAVTGETLLFDLERDPNEDRNVAAEHPDEVARLAALLPA
ncbi:MAG: sulfatase-like hydrolase/transferase [Planctomycetota bacterium]